MNKAQLLYYGFLKFTFNKLGNVIPQLLVPLAAPLWFKTPKKAIKDSQKEFLNKAETIHFAGQPNGFVCYQWGKSQKRVFIAHGWLGSSLDMEAIINFFLSKDYSVVSIDGPGHGQSEGSSSNLFIYGDSIKKAGKHFGEFDIVLAHSGGVLASLMAIDSQCLKAKQFIAVGLIGYVTTYWKKYYITPLSIPKKLDLALQRKFEKDFGQDVWYKVSSEAYVKNVNIPAVIVHDKDDKAIPIEEAEHIHQLLPDSTFIKTEGLGHHRILKSTELLDILEKQIIDSNNHGIGLKDAV